MVGLGQVVPYPVGFADHVETHWPGIDGVAVPGLIGELDAVIGENGVDPIGYGFQKMLEELSGHLSVRRCNELSDSEFGRSVNARKEIELTFSWLYLSDLDMEEPDTDNRVGPSRLFRQIIPTSAHLVHRGNLPLFCGVYPESSLGHFQFNDGGYAADALVGAVKVIVPRPLPGLIASRLDAFDDALV
jgi:hypothetical protein